MKINKKEKQLLMVLILLVVGYLSYNFMLHPMMSKVKELHTILDEKEAKVQAMEESIQRFPRNLEKLNGLKKEISPMAEKYFGRTDQEAFILYIHDLNNKSGLNITKVAFSDEINVNLSQALEENGEETTKEETKDTADGNLAVYELNELDDTSVANDDAKYSQNIKLMKAEIEFIGTYNQVLNLLNGVDNNTEHIISSQLQMERKGTEISQNDTDPQMKGKVLLSFYQVQDVNKYIPRTPSIPESRRIPKSAFSNPFQSYKWAWVFNAPVANDDLIEPTNTRNNSPSNNAGYQQPNDITVVLRRQEIFGFENPTFKTRGGQEASQMTAEPTKDIFISGKQAAKLNYTFKKMNEQEKLYIDLMDENICINEKLEEVTINAYAKDILPHEVGLILVDGDNKEYQVVLAKKVDWTGWKELSYDFKGLSKFPVQVKAIYVMPNKDARINEGEMVFDSIAVRFLSYKP